MKKGLTMSIKITCLEDFLRTIRQYSQSQDPKDKILWFRGVSDSQFLLLPRLFWLTQNKNLCSNVHLYNKKFMDKEKELLYQFKSRNYHLVNNFHSMNDFLFLSIMQHEGTATRLLDWSEDYRIAFFFALSDYFSQTKKPISLGIPTPKLWILRPLKLLDEIKQRIVPNLNEKLIPSLFDLEKGLEKIYGLRSRRIQSLTTNYPLPVYSPYNTERCKVQKGCFTLFPHLGNKVTFAQYSCSMEYSSSSALDSFLLLAPHTIYNELRILGLQRSWVFPEMPFTSQDIEEYSFCI